MRVTDIADSDPGDNQQLNYGYGYDKVDNITARQTEHGDYGYQYDELYRLTDVDNPDQSDESFDYDGVGNRKNFVDTTGDWTYNANNELEGYDNVTFQYDANGNMTEKNANGVITRFFYNLEDRLERVEDGAGSTIATYYYDPFGRRLWKEVAGTRTYFHYSDEGLVGEYDATGAEIKGYGWKPGGTWSTDPLFMRNQSGEYFWYHNDHLGTPQMMTTSSGAVVWKAKYTIFGKATVDNSSTVVNPLRFPGQYEDQETGLHYNWMRYYDSNLGRYLNADPIGQSGGTNLFLYCSSDPLNNFDPEGKFELTVPVIIIIVAVAITTVILMDQIRRNQPRTFPIPDYSDAKRKYKRYNVPPDVKDSPSPLPPPDNRSECEKLRDFIQSPSFKCSVPPHIQALAIAMYSASCGQFDDQTNPNNR